MDITPIILASINPFFGLLSLIFTGFITILTLKINNKVNNAKKVTDAVHILVNSNMGIQLKIAMRLAARVAKLTNTKEDIADARETKRLYYEHMNKQLIVDEKIKSEKIDL